ncbi:MAG: DEAD/DEAH box helicase [Methanobacteriota archaeon]
MFVSHSLIKPETVEERAYQIAIARSCVQRPTLVVLPTGIGKTMIAVLAMADILKRQKGKVLFLAPTKPLVEQHAQTLRDVLLVEEPAVFTGEMAPHERRESWSRYSIIVSTPQVIVNDLISGEMNLDDVSLLVFDEAHRAVGDYAYVFIGEKFANKGLVMGMTASPGSDPQKVMEVCANLGIQAVEIRSEDDPDVAPYLHDIDERWLRVDVPPEVKKLAELLRAILNDAVNALRNYGVLPRGKPASVRSILEAQQLIQAKLHSQAQKDPRLFHAQATVAMAMKANHALTMAETQGVGALLAYLERLEDDSTKSGRRLLVDPRIGEVRRIASKLDFEHPKVSRVVAVVEDELQSNPKAKIIVFTHYREISEMVTAELQKVRHVRALRFVGQATKGKDKGMKQKDQVERLQKFRDGEFNVLVATSVAEEGLDIPATDLVIFYEPVPSEIRTIQRRGRTGRSRAGKVVYLITKNTRDEGAYWVSRRKEGKMNDDMERLRAELKKRIAVGEPAETAFKSAFEAMASAPQGKVARRKVPDPSVAKLDELTDVPPPPGTGEPPAVAAPDETVHDAPSDAPDHPELARKGQARLADFKAQKVEPAIVVAAGGRQSASEPPPKTAEVVVDSRELNSSVVRELARMGLAVRTAQLPTGDYVVSERVAVERKEVADFLASMLDGRLFQQAKELKRAYQRPVMIIEGETLFGVRQVSDSAIYGALASIAGDFGVPVLFSKDPLETARMIHAFVKREIATGGGPPPMRSGKGGMLLHERQQFLVEGLPGISATLAQRLLAHFGSARAVMTASAEELCRVKGVGQATAEHIRKIIDERYLEKEDGE